MSLSLPDRNNDNKDIDVTTSSIVEDATEIISGLFLGNEQSSINQDFLTENNISTIINCANDCISPEMTGKDCSFVYVHYKIVDHSDSANVLKSYLYGAIQIIHNTLQQGQGVLVHCRAGVSRSATFILAYLMTYGTNMNSNKKMSFRDAAEIVKSKRPIINPNFGFCIVLKSLSEEYGFDD
jgi:protein tyrosine phosphatase